MKALTVVVEVIGRPVTGLWCPDCCLPSGFASVLSIAGRISSRWQCRDCGGHL